MFKGVTFVIISEYTPLTHLLAIKLPIGGGDRGCCLRHEKEWTTFDSFFAKDDSLVWISVISFLK